VKHDSAFVRLAAMRLVEAFQSTGYEGFGQKRVSDFAKLAFNGLPEIRQNLDLSAHFYSSTKNNRGNVLRIPFPINN
jgi:hypothetical protein